MVLMNLMSHGLMCWCLTGGIDGRGKRVQFCLVLGVEVAVRVIEMVGSVAERVYFELGKKVLRKLLKEPIENQAPLYTSL
jgi:hypothetical protein